MEAFRCSLCPGNVDSGRHMPGALVSVVTAKTSTCPPADSLRLEEEHRTQQSRETTSWTAEGEQPWEWRGVNKTISGGRGLGSGPDSAPGHLGDLEQVTSPVSSPKNR